ncbi:unnamed protein product [Linum trigynum]|uniref:40S ribosomal protein S12 n=1 Tax=Linum trigynum TaxID=586398 RepID=A0AAV2DTJ8_9ROSI
MSGEEAPVAAVETTPHNKLLADYVKLVKALCADYGVALLSVPNVKTLGEWAGLCKIDSEGNARKVVGCSCVVVKDYGEESEAFNIVQQHIKSHKLACRKPCHSSQDEWRLASFFLLL